MDLYTSNGTIIRLRDRGEGLAEVELQFLDLSRSSAYLTSIAAWYLAFVVRRPIPFVLSSYTRQNVILFKEAFDEPAREMLIGAVVDVRNHLAELLLQAELLYYPNQEKGAVETGNGELLGYQAAQLDGKEFLEAFVRVIQ